MTSPPRNPSQNQQDPVAGDPDGIPRFANGRALNEIEIKALREARDRTADTAPNGTDQPAEIGGARRDKEPTRYNDWEVAGRAIDF
ncbi:MAG: DUF1674 domain-containing protein [Parvularcula sp.]